MSLLRSALMALPLITGLTMTSCSSENSGLPANFETRLVPVAEGYSETSVNAVIFRRNSLVTHKNNQFIAFYDDQGRVVLGKRQLDEDRWQLHTSEYEGNVTDAHNSISIAVDGDGYLHISWDHHNNPLNYARSLEPGGLRFGEPEQLGEASAGHTVTYPEFYRMPDGDLLFMYRHGWSGDGVQVLHRYDVESRSWELLHEQLIDGQGEVNPYWQTTIDDSGTLHLSWNWRSHAGVESNHDLAYARSRDGGITWERSDGEPYNLPITPETAEYALRIPENSSMMNQTSMAADSRGKPYIAGYWTPEGSDIPQYHVVYHDGESWQVTRAGELTQPFTLTGGGTMAPPISRPQIAVEHTDGRERVYLFFRAEERGNRVSVAICDDLDSDEWYIGDLTDMSVDAWEPAFDTELWRRDNKLHLYVQKVGQDDHERAVEMDPQMVYVLEWER